MRDLTIKDYYNSLDKENKRKFRLKVCSTIGIEYSSLMYRMNRNTWTKLERETVSDIIKNKSYATY